MRTEAATNGFSHLRVGANDGHLAQHIHEVAVDIFRMRKKNS